MRTAFAWLAAVAVVFGWIAPDASAQPYKVGVAAPLTGPRAADGVAIQRAVELFEAAHPDIDVVVQDDGADAGKAAAVARTLLDAGVVAAVGHLGDEGARAAAPVYDGAKVSFLAADASDAAIARLGDHVYTMTYTDDAEGKRMVAYALGVLDAQTVAVLHGDDPHSRSVAKAVGRAAQAVGLTVSRTASWPDAAPPADFVRGMYPQMPAASARGARLRMFGRRGTDMAKRMGVDAFLVIGPGGAQVLAELRGAGVDVPVVGNDRWDTAALDGEGVYLTAGNTWDIETQDGRAWRAGFAEDAPPTDAALYTYEALQLVAEAVAKGATDAAGVSAFLGQMVDADTAVQGLSALMYFDRDGALQREPWFLTPSRGRLRPAYTQLRLVVDPRERWRAMRQQLAPPPPPTSPEPVVAPEPAPDPGPLGRGIARGIPPASPEPAEEQSARERRQQERAQEGVRAAARVVAQTGPRRVVRVGDEAYHLTAVVYTGIDFYRVNDVDVEGHAFEVELFLWFSWQGDVDIDEIGFLNQIFTEDATKEVLREDRDGDVKYVCYKVKGRFLHPFDMHEFPFDAQELPIQLSHPTRDGRDVLLVVDHDRLSHAAVGAIYPEEWTFTGRTDVSAMYEPNTTFGDPAWRGKSSSSAFSVYEARIGIQRILFPYLVKLFLPLFIMVAVSLFVLVVPPAQFDARMTLVMTGLLSVLVFHLSQEEGLPSVGYLMRSDQYFMITYVLFFILIVKTVAVNAVYERAEALTRWGERAFGLVFVPLTILAYFWVTM